MSPHIDAWAHLKGVRMKKLDSHYKKIANLSKRKYTKLNDEELLSLYQFEKDFDVLLNEFEIVIAEDLYIGYLSGIFRTSTHSYYRMDCDGQELFIIADDSDSGGLIVSYDDFMLDFKKEVRKMRWKRSKERGGVYAFTFLTLIIAMLILFAPKQSDKLLIEFTNSQTHNYSSVSELYANHNKGIVTIHTYSSETSGPSVATGMMITKDGYLISCTHIYDDIPNAKFNVILSDGSMHRAIFVSGDIESDICLLKIIEPDRDYDIVYFGDSDNVNPGDQAVIMGFPGGASIEPIVTSGIISSTDVRHNNLTGYLNSYIQTDATANPGNSGGGLFNMKGQIIGIVTSKYTQLNYEGTIYSIPSRTIKQVINDLFYKGYVARPTLGITFTEVSANEMDNGLPYGSKVVEVKESSMAFGLLNENDIITKVNGKAMTPAYELYDALLCLNEDNLLMECEVYNQETKMYRTVTFEATLRYSSTGYTQE
jgi:serine protease Do